MGNEQRKANELREEKGGMVQCFKEKSGRVRSARELIKEKRDTQMAKDMKHEEMEGNVLWECVWREERARRYGAEDTVDLIMEEIQAYGHDPPAA